MRKKILVIVIESVNRELLGKLTLSLRALKRDYRVIIGSKGMIWNIIKFINPAIVLLKSFGPRNNDFIDFLKKNKFKILSNDEELLLSYEIKERVKYRMKHENIFKLDKIISVGDFDNKAIREEFPTIKDKVIKNGNIRIELLKKKYYDFFANDTSLIKKKYGNFILFTTSFGRLNQAYRRESDIDFIFHRVVNEYLDPTSREVALENCHINTQRNVLMRSLRFIDNFEKNFPSRKLIISVKPGENLKFWQNYFKKRSFVNVFLREDYDVFTTQHYIFASDIVISSNSTTLLEAYKLNKITINNLDSSVVPSEIEFLKKSSYVCRSYEELISSLNNIINGKKKYMNVDDDLSKYIINSNENLDGCESLLNTIDSFKDLDHDMVFRKNLRYYLFFLNYIRVLKRKIKLMINKFFANKNKLTKLDKLHIMKIGNRLEKENFMKVLKKLNEIEKVSDLKVYQIVPNAFLLDKK